MWEIWGDMGRYGEMTHLSASNLESAHLMDYSVRVAIRLQRRSLLACVPIFEFGVELFLAVLE